MTLLTFCSGKTLKCDTSAVVEKVNQRSTNKRLSVNMTGSNEFLEGRRERRRGKEGEREREGGREKGREGGGRKGGRK